MPYIDCSLIVDRINTDTKSIVDGLSYTPDLLVLMPSEDFSAASYYRAIERQGAKLGIGVRARKFQPDIDEDQLFGLIDFGVNGVMILSEPPHLYGVRDQLGRLEHGNSAVNVEGDDHNDDVVNLFCTARACWEVIEDHYDGQATGYNAVLVGYGKRVGKPLSYLLMRKHLGSVTITHKYTHDLGFHTKRADILISAVGKPNIISPSMVKHDALVIDVGCSAEGKGDVDPDVAKGAFVTPVPAGVGSITTALLMKNVAMVAARHEIIL